MSPPSLASRLTFALLSLAGLGCGGLFVDPARVTALLAQVTAAPPQDALTTLAVGVAEVELVNPLCAACLAAMDGAAPDQRATLAAMALTESTCACPSTCASEALTPDVTLDVLTDACDAKGPEPIFTGDLAPRRASARPVEYALARLLAETLDPEQQAVVREALAVGLTSHLPAVAEPTDDVPTPAADVATPPSPEPPRPAVPSPEVEPALVAPSSPAPTGAVVPSGDGLSSDVIRRVIQRASAKFRSCNAETPDFQGKVTIQFTVAPDGRVSVAVAEEGDPAIGACLARHFRALTFPEAASPTTVRYPISFATN